MRRGQTLSPLKVAETTQDQISYECGCAITLAPEPGDDTKAWPCDDPSHWRHLMNVAARAASRIDGRVDVIEMAGHA